MTDISLQRKIIMPGMVLALLVWKIIWKLRQPGWRWHHITVTGCSHDSLEIYKFCRIVILVILKMKIPKNSLVQILQIP